MLFFLTWNLYISNEFVNNSGSSSNVITNSTLGYTSASDLALSSTDTGINLSIYFAYLNFPVIAANNCTTSTFISLMAFMDCTYFVLVVAQFVAADFLFKATQ